MKGSIGTSMNGSIVKGKPKKARCNCQTCREYLKTNPLCRIGRDTKTTKACKWYYKK